MRIGDTDIHQTLRYKKFCLNQSNKFIVVPQRHQRFFLHSHRNNLYNGNILYIKNYTDTYIHTNIYRHTYIHT